MVFFWWHFGSGVLRSFCILSVGRAGGLFFSLVGWFSVGFLDNCMGGLERSFEIDYFSFGVDGDTTLFCLERKKVGFLIPSALSLCKPILISPARRTSRWLSTDLDGTLGNSFLVSIMKQATRTSCHWAFLR